MPLEFGRGAFIKLGEEGTYGTIAASMPVDNRIISASFQKTQEKERKTHLSQSDLRSTGVHPDVYFNRHSFSACYGSRGD